MSKWIRERMRRRRKKPSNSAEQGQNPPPLQPNFISNELPPQQTVSAGARGTGEADSDSSGLKSQASAHTRAASGSEERVQRAKPRERHTERQASENAPAVASEAAAEEPAGGVAQTRAEGQQPGRRRRRRGRRGRGGRGAPQAGQATPQIPAQPEAEERAAQPLRTEGETPDRKSVV